MNARRFARGDDDDNGDGETDAISDDFHESLVSSPRTDLAFIRLTLCVVVVSAQLCRTDAITSLVHISLHANDNSADFTHRSHLISFIVQSI